MKTIFSKLQTKGNSKLTNIVFIVFFALLISLNTQSQTTVVSVLDGNWSDVSSCTISYETGEPLPIELLSFTADCRDGTAEINWSTASETNNDYFTLEKCKDEAFLVSDNWEIVTIVKGAGNSSTILNYRVTDVLRLADETIYYRLKKTDFNGAFAYSNTIATNCLQREVEFKFIGVTAQSNEGFITVLFNSDAGHSYKLELYDILGRLLTIEKLPESVYGFNAIKVNASGLSEGTCLIVLKNENEILIVKMRIL